MIRRNLYFAPRSVKTKAYLATVRPILEFASICWDPIYQKQKNTLEMVQRSAAKFVTNCYPRRDADISVTKLVKELGWDSLEERRKQNKLVMAYMILNNQSILEPEMLRIKEHSITTRRNHVQEIKLLEPYSRLNSTKNNFFYNVPCLWNTTISKEQAKATSVKAFKKHFK